MPWIFHRFMWLVTALAAFSLSGCCTKTCPPGAMAVPASPPQVIAPVVYDQSYRPVVGDVLTVRVAGEADLTGDYSVNDKAAIVLPLVGSVSVNGRTLADVQQAVTDAYRDGYLVNPVISVDVKGVRP